MAEMNQLGITKTPGVCGGKACIAGHRVRVMDVVVWHELRSLSPEEIVYQFPGITLASVHAALAYYFSNRQEIEADFRAEEAGAEKLKSQYRSKLRERLGG